MYHLSHSQHDQFVIHIHASNLHRPPGSLSIDCRKYIGTYAFHGEQGNYYFVIVTYHFLHRHPWKDGQEHRTNSIKTALRPPLLTKKKTTTMDYVFADRWPETTQSREKGRKSDQEIHVVQ